MLFIAEEFELNNQMALKASELTSLLTMQQLLTKNVKSVNKFNSVMIYAFVEFFTKLVEVVERDQNFMISNDMRVMISDLQEFKR